MHNDEAPQTANNGQPDTARDSSGESLLAQKLTASERAQAVADAVKDRAERTACGDSAALYCGAFARLQVHLESAFEREDLLTAENARLRTARDRAVSIIEKIAAEFRRAAANQTRPRMGVIIELHREIEDALSDWASFE